jgi:lipoprotein-releasing system ATP-binding protein
MATAKQVPALYLSKVERRYSQGEDFLHVLRGADLAIWPGEIVALVAPSGTGKSTLLHVAGLLEKPDGGEVYVGGRPTASMDDAGRTALRRADLGFVYQFHHLLPEFSALENVVMPQLILGLRRADAEERGTQLLSFLGLAERLDHRPGSASPLHERSPMRRVCCSPTNRRAISILKLPVACSTRWWRSCGRRDSRR